MKLILGQLDYFLYCILFPVEISWPTSLVASFPTVTIQTDLFLCFSFHNIHLFVELMVLSINADFFLVVGLDISLLSLTRFSYKTWSIVHVCRSFSFLVSHIAIK